MRIFKAVWVMIACSLISGSAVAADLVIGANDFVPDRDRAGDDRWFSGTFAATTVDGAGINVVLRAAVVGIPDGATISGFRCVALDNSAANMTFQLIANRRLTRVDSTSTSTVSTISTEGLPSLPVFQNLGTTLTHVVDYLDESFFGYRSYVIRYSNLGCGLNTELCKLSHCYITYN